MDIHTTIKILAGGVVAAVLVGVGIFIDKNWLSKPAAEISKTQQVDITKPTPVSGAAMNSIAKFPAVITLAIGDTYSSADSSFVLQLKNIADGYATPVAGVAIQWGEKSGLVNFTTGIEGGISSASLAADGAIHIPPAKGDAFTIMICSAATSTASNVGHATLALSKGDSPAACPAR